MPTLFESGFLGQLWTWAKANDLPNWFSVALTAVIWPLSLIWWQRRKVAFIKGLELRFSDGNIAIGNTNYSAVAIDFINHTGAVVYVTGARITHTSELCKVPTDATRDIAENSYHLKFIDNSTGFNLREITLQTQQSKRTCLPVSAPMPEDFFRHVRSRFDKIFCRHRYFVIEYTVMVGDARHYVATRY